MERWSYLIHLLLWLGPVILLEWLVAGRTFLRNEIALTAPTLLAGSLFSVIAFFAVKWELLGFEPSRTLGITLGDRLPLETVLFCFLSSLLIAQTYLMLLPRDLKR